MELLKKDIIRQSHQLLKEHFTAPFEQQGFEWRTNLYELMPQCYYEVRGGITDPSGRPYIAARLCTNGEIDRLEASMRVSENHKTGQDEIGIMNYPALNYYALQRLAGIAVISAEENQRPDALLRLGSIWSFHEYLELAGCGNVIADFEQAYSINPNNPFEVIIKDTDRHTVGKPSEAFFPPYIQEIISEEIQGAYSNSNPDFSLLTEMRYAVPMSILITLGFDLSNEQKSDLQNQLTWYMPPYLPVKVHKAYCLHPRIPCLRVSNLNSKSLQL